MRAIGPVDCDLHPAPRMAELLPYLDAHWREQITTRGIDGLDLVSYPPRAPLSCRPDWRNEAGIGAPDAATLARQALDPYGSRFGILNCLHGSIAMYSEDMGAALARAVNDWLVEHWLDRDPRLRASVTVCMRDPALAAAEIDRRAADRRFVQVLLLVSGDMPLGRRLMWPIYEAAQRHDMPVGIHAGSLGHNPLTPMGWPSYVVEDYVSQAAAMQSQVQSLVSEGVFSRFPRLRVVLLEGGVTWLPPFLWRFDKEWRSLRSEVPWVDRPPSAIIREHVRMTTTPTDVPPHSGQMRRIVEQIGADHMLLFSTDYPHWQFDDADGPLPAGLPPALLPRIALNNARATYPGLQETPP
ncbi:MAG: amidohydrolase [Acetobacteraceae bacterium]|nr:amidohydrolase [Acetobacteraceae bacterium]